MFTLNVEDVHSGLFLCQQGTAEHRWGRSLSRHPQATACRHGNMALNPQGKTNKCEQYCHAQFAYLEWPKEAMSFTSNTIITTEKKENIALV